MRLAAFLACLLAGCPPAFGDYEVVGGDGGIVPRRDTGTPPPPPGCRYPVTCAAGCPRPWLLASVEDLPGGEECAGSVARWSLADRDGVCSCNPLRGGGELPALLRAVGVYPPATVVVASENEVVAVDGATDTISWRSPGSGDIPGPIFALRSPDDGPRIAIGLRRGEDVRSIVTYAPGGGAQRETWIANDGSFPLGLSVSSLTQDPSDPNTFLAVKPGTYGAAEVDPWNLERIEPPYVNDREGFVLRHVHSLYHDPFFHTSWAGTQDGEPAVFNLQRGEFTDRNGVPLGSSCNNMTCDEYEHVVADPTLNTGMITICRQGGERSIVRLASTNSTCAVLATEAELPAGSRFTQLAIAADTFWR